MRLLRSSPRQHHDRYAREDGEVLVEESVPLLHRTPARTPQRRHHITTFRLYCAACSVFMASDFLV
jgi:hypothetical protein